MSNKQDQLVESVKLLVNQIKLRENEIELIKERCTKIKTRINYIKTFHEDSIELTELLKKIPCNFINTTPFQENRQVRELELENAELQLSLEEHQAAMEIIMTKYRQQIHALIHNNHIDWPIIRDQECQYDMEMRTSIDQISNMGDLMWTSIKYDSDFIYDLEIISSLRLENEGLEKMLADSSSFGNSCTWNMDEIGALEDDQSTAAMSESTTSGGLGGLATPDDDTPLCMSSSFCSVKNVPKSDKVQPVNGLSTFKNVEPLFPSSYTENSDSDFVQNLPIKKEYKQCNGHINGHGDIHLNLAKFENGNPVFVNNEIITLNQSKGKENDLKNYKSNLNTINGSLDSLEFDNLSESTLEYESDVTLASDSESFNTRDLVFNSETLNQTEDDVPSPNDIETPCSLVYITSPINGISNKILYDEKSACLIDQCSPKNKSWTIEKNIHRSSDVTVINQVVNNNEND